MRTFLAATVAALLGISFAAAPSAEARECAPTVQDGWIRLGPSAMPMMAGFGRIVNACNKPVTIVAASSSAFEEVSIHESRRVEGVNRMRELKALRIAPDDSAVLKPGGLHLMLMRPLKTLKEGSKVKVNFKLSDGGEVQAELVLRKPAP